MYRSRPQAFLALPSALPTSADINEIIRETVRAYDVVPWSAIDDLDAGASSSGGVHEALRESDFVIADITGNNPNVMFEVGFGMGLGKDVLLLAQKGPEGIPFDLRYFQVASYRPDDLEPIRKYVMVWLREALSSRAADSSLP